MARGRLAAASARARNPASSQARANQFPSRIGYSGSICNMSSEQKKRLLKAKIAVALQNELGRVPTKKEIDQVSLLARVMYKAVLGLHYKRGEQKKSGQLAIF